MRRSEIRKLYEITTRVNPDTGREERTAVYIGKRYAVNREAIRKRRAGLWLLLLAAVAAFLTAGLVPATAQMCLWALLPYALCLLPLFYGVMGLWKVSRFGDIIDEIQRQEGLLSLQHAAVGLCVLSALWLAGDVVYGLQLGFDMWDTPDWCFLAMSAVTLAAGVGLWWTSRGLEMKELPSAQPDAPAQEN